jgi:hypothetical protein
MPPIGSEKALRKLVIELASATPEDIVAVLAMLDARTRATVRSLLAAYTDLSDVFSLDVPPAANTARLSGWLAARTLGQSREGDDYRITPKTLETLQMIVASLPPLPVSEDPGHMNLRARFDGGNP